MWSAAAAHALQPAPPMTCVWCTGAADSCDAAVVWKPFCRCLCFGFVLHTTRTTPFRLTILQALHIRFTDWRTFIPAHTQLAMRTADSAAGVSARLQLWDQGCIRLRHRRACPLWPLLPAAAGDRRGIQNTAIRILPATNSCIL